MAFHQEQRADLRIAGTGLPRPVSLGELAPADRLLWGTLALLGALIPPWEHATAVTIGGLPQMALIVVTLLGARAAYVVLRPNARRIHVLLDTAASLLAYTAILATISYLCTRNTNPLRDSWFLAADQALGFDWQAVAEFEANTPILSTMLSLAYSSLVIQTIVIIAILPLVKGGQRGYSLIRASVLCATAACVGSYFLPAAIAQGAGHEDWYLHWAALRGSAPFEASLAQLTGIITFPSFHASLAVLFAYSMRGLGPLSWAFAGLNVLMVASTPSYGSHYLGDVIAGLLLAVAAIAVVRRLDRQRPPAGAAT